VSDPDTNPTKEYRAYLRDNLPLGITFDEASGRYLSPNGKQFVTYSFCHWYTLYLVKLQGLSDGPPE